MAVLCRSIFCSAVLASIVAACAGPHQNTGIPPQQPFENRGASSGPISWPTFGFNRARWSFNPYESALTPQNVANLTLKWSFSVAGWRIDTQPIVAANVAMPSGGRAQIVYVGDENSDFYALDASSGKRLWFTHLGKGDSPCWSWQSNGISSTPAVDSSAKRVYVIDGAGVLRAFDPASGAESAGFPPLQVWSYPRVNHTWSGLLLDATDSTLYLPTASHCDAGVYFGMIKAVNTATQAITTFQLVRDKNAYYGNGVWGWGGESLAPDGDIFAGVGNSKGGEGEEGEYSDSVIELTRDLNFVADDQPESDLHGDLDIGTTPVLFYEQGAPCAAFERKDGNFFTVNRNQLQEGAYATKLHLGGVLAAPAYSPVTHALYVSVPDGLTRLNIGRDCHVWQAWQTPIDADGLSVPAATPQLVFAAGKTGTLYAIDAQTGSLLWNSGSTIKGRIAAEPTVVNGMVYATAWDGRIYAFGL